MGDRPRRLGIQASTVVCWLCHVFKHNFTDHHWEWRPAAENWHGLHQALHCLEGTWSGRRNPRGRKTHTFWPKLPCDYFWQSDNDRHGQHLRVGILASKSLVWSISMGIILFYGCFGGDNDAPPCVLWCQNLRRTQLQGGHTFGAIITVP